MKQSLVWRKAEKREKHVVSSGENKRKRSKRKVGCGKSRWEENKEKQVVMKRAGRGRDN